MKVTILKNGLQGPNLFNLIVWNISNATIHYTSLKPLCQKIGLGDILEVFTSLPLIDEFSTDTIKTPFARKVSYKEYF